MRKKIILAFFFLFFLFFSTKSVLASFSCTVSPNPVVNNGTSQDTTLTFYSTDIKKGMVFSGEINKKTSTTGTCPSSLVCKSNNVTASSDNTITITWSSVALDVADYQVLLWNEPKPGTIGACNVSFSVTSSGTPPPPVFCSSIQGARCYKYSCSPPDAPAGYKSVAATCTGFDFSCCIPDSIPVYTCNLAGGQCITGKECDDVSGTTDSTKTCPTNICCLPVIVPPPPPPTTDCSSSEICCKCTNSTDTLINTSSLGTPNWVCVGSSTRYSPTILPACSNGQICDPTGKGCIDASVGGITNGINPYDTAPPPAPCAQALDSKGNCPQVASAFGINIPTDMAGFIKTLFGIILTLVGSIAVLLIIISGYKLITSHGNPEHVKEAQEQLTAAIIGLLFVVFSLVFLETIGADVLGLPGIFGG